MRGGTGSRHGACRSGGVVTKGWPDRSSTASGRRRACPTLLALGLPGLFPHFRNAAAALPGVAIAAALVPPLAAEEAAELYSHMLDDVLVIDIGAGTIKVKADGSYEIILSAMPHEG